jgi:hypothetical protein
VGSRAQPVPDCSCDEQNLFEEWLKQWALLFRSTGQPLFLQVIFITLSKALLDFTKASPNLPARKSSSAAKYSVLGVCRQDAAEILVGGDGARVYNFRSLHHDLSARREFKFQVRRGTPSQIPPQQMA